MIIFRELMAVRFDRISMSTLNGNLYADADASNLIPLANFMARQHFSPAKPDGFLFDNNHHV